MKPAAAYIRVSTDDQLEYSPDAQLRALKSWAHSNGYLIDQDHIYIDEGVSGRRAERRPAFMAMIGAAKCKPAPFEAILVHKFDRFARSREDSVVYKSLLRKECGVRVISITESIDDDRFSIILEAMLEAMAEYYSINLAEEVRKGMTEKARRGERQTSAPFGYRMESGELVPHPEEAAVVRELFTRFAAGESYFVLARWLNDSGYRTRRGNAFQNRSVRYIFTNPTYAGFNAWTPSRAQNRNTEYLMDDATILEKGSHKPIVPDDLWQAVQARVANLREQFGHDRHPPQHADWLSGLAHCSACGEPMVRNRQTDTKVYWVCNGYAHGRCTVTNSVSDRVLKEHFISSLRSSAKDSDFLFSAARAALQKRSPAQSAPKLLAALDARLARAQEAYRAGVDTLDEYAAAKRAILSERESLLARLSSESPDEAAVAELSRRFSNRLADLADLLESSASLDSKHEAAHSTISTAVWDKSAPSLSILYSLD